MFGGLLLWFVVVVEFAWVTWLNLPVGTSELLFWVWSLLFELGWASVLHTCCVVLLGLVCCDLRWFFGLFYWWIVYLLCLV